MYQILPLGVYLVNEMLVDTDEATNNFGVDQNHLFSIRCYLAAKGQLHTIWQTEVGHMFGSAS